VSHPDRLPDLFVDRSLGRIEVPRLLRDHGLRLTTLAERYGIPADERVSDVRWLKDSGERGEAVLMKDARIRYNEAEKIAVMRFGVQCFCLSRQDLPAADMANRFIQKHRPHRRRLLPFYRRLYLGRRRGKAEKSSIGGDVRQSGMAFDR